MEDILRMVQGVRLVTWLAAKHRLLMRATGNLVYIELPRQPIVVLNSAKAVTDLLDKRAAIYSDRPISFASEM